jgi:hypothetical protein
LLVVKLRIFFGEVVIILKRKNLQLILLSLDGITFRHFGSKILGTITDLNELLFLYIVTRLCLLLLFRGLIEDGHERSRCLSGLGEGFARRFDIFLLL